MNETISLPSVPNHEFPIRVYRLRSSLRNSGLALLIYFHGGYWVSGDANSKDLGCRAIVARGRNIVAVSFGYRLVPDVS